MPGVDGKTAFVDQNGKMFLYADPLEARNLGLRPATEQEFSTRTAAKERAEKFGSTGQQGIALAEKFGESATLGLLPDFPGAADRKSELERQSPFLAMGAEGAGAIVPALAGAGLASGAARAAGLGARGIGLATSVAEGAVGGITAEQERIRGTEESFDSTNALMFGVGGELFAGALGRAVRGVASGADNILGRVEQSSLKAQAGAARRTGKEAERAVAMAEAPDAFEADAFASAESAASKLDLEDLRNPAAKARLNELVPPTAPAHEEWATEFVGRLRRVASGDEGAAVRVPMDNTGKPVSLEGLSLEDLGASSSGMKQESLDALRKGGEFERTGRAAPPREQMREFFQKSGLDGITLRRKGDGYVLQDGRHRVTVARERGMSEVHGRLLGRGDKVLYEGPIPVGPKRSTGPPGVSGEAVEELATELFAANSSQKMFRATTTAYDRLASLGDEAAPVRQFVAEALDDASLWGRAGELNSQARAAADTLAGFRDADGLVAALRSPRAQEAVGALEQALSARKAYGVAVDEKLVKHVDAIRQAARDLADVQVARAKGAEPAPKPTFRERIGGALGGNVGAALTGDLAPLAIGLATDSVGAALGAGAVVHAARGAARVWRAMGQAQKAVILDSARRFVRRGAKGLSGTATLTVAPAATAIQRFTGGYSSPEQAYHARVDIIQQAAERPSLLAEALAGSLGDLPTSDPAAFGSISKASYRALNYVASNLPAPVAASMMSPRGLPPSRQTVREVALLWNSAFEPETVLESVADGTAVPSQVRTLEAVHPQLYQQLRTAVIGEVAQAPAQVSTQTKVWLDILFNADGLAGLSYSWGAGNAFKTGMPPEQQTPSGTLPVTSKQVQQGQPQTPRGLAAAQSGPTNSA